MFPKNKVDGCQTINQARGINRLIDDRFDLTLECIRRHYLSKQSPLTQTLENYKEFFSLFVTFKEYVDFFLLNDLVDGSGEIKFYLPFDGFQNKPNFNSINDYRLYADRVHQFIDARNARILQSWTCDNLS